MNRGQIGYWIATALFCLALGGGGVMNLIHAEPQRITMEALGYPAYVMTLLGIFKLLGVVTLVLPALKRLKEWAYAGFTFDLIGAAFSHASAGDPAEALVPPTALLLVGAASYFLRPESRRL